MYYNPKCLPIHYRVYERRAPCVVLYCTVFPIGDVQDTAKRPVFFVYTCICCNFNVVRVHLCVYIMHILFLNVLITLGQLFFSLPSAPSPIQFPFQWKTTWPNLKRRPRPYVGALHRLQKKPSSCSLHSRLFFEQRGVWDASRISCHAFSSNTAWRKDLCKKSERKA